MHYEIVELLEISSVLQQHNVEVTPADIVSHLTDSLETNMIELR